MKRWKLIFSSAAMMGALLAGCASQPESAFSPTESCVYVAEDGSLSSALVQACEGEEINEADLKQYLEAAVIRFNESRGAEAAAANKQGADRLPAALSSVSGKDGVLKAIFDYGSLEDLIAFRQTEDNEDNSNTITGLEVKKMADAGAAGWLSEKSLVKADGSEVSAEEAAKDGESIAVSIEGGGTVMFSGKVLYRTADTEQKDEYTVAVPEGGSALVVFK